MLITSLAPSPSLAISQFWRELQLAFIWACLTGTA